MATVCRVEGREERREQDIHTDIHTYGRTDIQRDRAVQDREGQHSTTQHRRGYSCILSRRLHLYCRALCSNLFYYFVVSYFHFHIYVI